MQAFHGICFVGNISNYHLVADSQEPVRAQAVPKKGPSEIMV